MRGPNPFGFHQSASGAWISQQQRDRTVFQDGVVKIEDPDTGEAMELSTSSITRGHSLWFGPVDQQVDDTGIVRISRNGIVERYRPYRWATEQAWQFDEQPSGTGDLVVHVNVGNVTLVESVPEGLHFKSTTAEFLYEPATWIDANGVRTKATMTWSGSDIVITVPSSVVGNSAYPAVLDPLTGPWTGLTGKKPAYAPSVASNGSSKYLVAWEDYSSLSNAGQIYYAIYDTSNGTFVKTATALAASSGVQQGEPAVGYDGTNFLVAYWDAASNSHRVKAARVDPSTGSAGSPVTFTTTNGAADEGSPSVGCKTGQCGIAWHRTISISLPDAGVTLPDAASNAGGNQATEIIFSTWKSTGTSFNGPLTVTNGTPNHYAASVATDGTNYFVVWEQGAVGSANVGAATIVPGTSSDSVGTGSPATLVASGSGEAYGPAAAYAGTAGKFVVAFSRYNGTDDDANAVIATSSTSAAASASSEATIANGSGDQDDVAIACKSGQCVGAYYESSTIKTKSISASTGAGSGGATLNSVTTSYRDNPKLGYGGSGLLAVWNDQGAGYYQTYGRTVGTSGSAGGTQQFLISQ